MVRKERVDRGRPVPRHDRARRGRGARLGRHGSATSTPFHLFYGALAVFATPAAAVAVWYALAATARDAARARLAIVAGRDLRDPARGGRPVRDRPVGSSSGRTTTRPSPLAILAAIEELPARRQARLRAASRPRRPPSGTPSSLGLDAHTGRRVVPMCFQAETFGLMTGTPISPDVPSPLFRRAPQRALYPTSAARAVSRGRSRPS